MQAWVLLRWRLGEDAELASFAGMFSSQEEAELALADNQKAFALLEVEPFFWRIEYKELEYDDGWSFEGLPELMLRRLGKSTAS